MRAEGRHAPAARVEEVGHRTPRQGTDGHRPRLDRDHRRVRRRRERHDQASRDRQRRHPRLQIERLGVGPPIATVTPQRLFLSKRFP
jgi:hypothetical protein